MHAIVLEKPYRFIPPKTGRLWPRLFRPLWKPYLRRHWGIHRLEVRGWQTLRQAARRRHAVLLAPNHPRPCDPMVVAALYPWVGRPLFTMASWHQFHQGPLARWLLPRCGAFSVLREGADRQAIQAAVDLLCGGQGPVVIFPEGAITRHNDLLARLSPGITLVARRAARRLAASGSAARVLLFPVAIKYFFEGDAEAVLRELLACLEARLSWPTQHHRPLLQRLQRLIEAWLALRELEHWGCLQTGTIYQRMYRLQEHLLRPLEQKYLNGHRQGDVIARARRLRAAIAAPLMQGTLSAQERQARWQELAAVYLAQQLSLYPKDYLSQYPSAERVLETAERLEEDMTDSARILRPWRTVVQIGDPIQVPAQRVPRQNDPLLELLAETQQRMLEALQHESPTVFSGAFGHPLQGERFPAFPGVPEKRTVYPER